MKRFLISNLVYVVVNFSVLYFFLVMKTSELVKTRIIVCIVMWALGGVLFPFVLRIIDFRVITFFKWFANYLMIVIVTQALSHYLYLLKYQAQIGADYESSLVFKAVLVLSLIISFVFYGIGFITKRYLYLRT